MSQSATVIRLLLVEDDPVSRAFLGDALASLPAQVDVADCIAGAEFFASQRQHDLWLIDAHLPDGDGRQCLQRLRDLHAAIPALAVTADAFVEELDALCAAGFIEAVQKPVTVAVLLSSVRRALGEAMPPTAFESGAKLPVWDDVAALSALAGNASALAALRTLFFAELPGQGAQAAAAFESGDVVALLSVLHKLKASCGFVGAARLRRAVQDWSQLPLASERKQRFEHAIADLLAASQTQA